MIMPDLSAAWSLLLACLSGTRSDMAMKPRAMPW